MRSIGIALTLVLWGASASAEPGFDPEYERDYNIFNPLTELQPDNPRNPINATDPRNPFNPINSVAPGNLANPITRDNPTVPFRPLSASPILSPPSLHGHSIMAQEKELEAGAGQFASCRSRVPCQDRGKPVFFPATIRCILPGAGCR